MCHDFCIPLPNSTVLDDLSYVPKQIGRVLLRWGKLYGSLPPDVAAHDEGGS